MKKKYFIRENKTAEEALRIIDKNKEKTCFVINAEKKLLGSLTDGDVRRSLYKRKKNIKELALSFCNKNPKFLIDKRYSKKKLKNIFNKKMLDVIPIVDKNKIIKKLILKKDVFETYENKSKKKKKISTEVVIMAGGLGTRLDPLTKIIPKPLVPIKNQTAIEYIAEKFENFGINNFYFSIGFKGNLIKAYFKDIDKKIKINYLEEKKRLGTAGGLKKLEGKMKKSFFVTNCDTFFDFNFYNLFNFHKKNNFDITSVISRQKFVIPYGVCEVNDKNEIQKFKEKPITKHKINTGLYLIKPYVLKLIPKNKYFDMTDLIQKSIDKNYKVGAYFINKKKWNDIGQLKEYKKNLKAFNG